MAMPPVDGGSGDDSYTPVSQASSWRVNANGTVTPVEVITVTSDKYGVTFTFTITQHEFQMDGGAGVSGERTAQVNYIATVDHVQGIRWEEDAGSDGGLYNYLVVTVGTDDGEITTDVRIRMDSIGTPGAFAAVDKAWANLVALGATA